MRKRWKRLSGRKKLLVLFCLSLVGLVPSLAGSHAKHGARPVREPLLPAYSVVQYGQDGTASTVLVGGQESRGKDGKSKGDLSGAKVKAEAGR